MSQGPDDALFDENNRTRPDSQDLKTVQIGRIGLKAGGSIDQVQIAYRTWGELNPTGTNAVLVCHAVSGDSNAAQWWDRIVGPGCAIDPDRHYIVCANALGGCQGTTGPTSLQADGEPWGKDFPAVTVEDMALCHARLLDHLGIESLLLACGGSMGGMQALALATGHAERVRNVWLTASAARHSAMQIGFNEAGRQAVMRDPRWMGGTYEAGSGPDHGLSVARMIGHLSYLSEASFEAKFGRRLQDSEDFSYRLEPEFQVESYLNYQGDKFTHRFDANSYLVLTKAIDRYDCQALRGARARFLLTSFSSDWLYPSWQSEEVCRMALAAGLEANHEVIDLPYGHDSFLLDGSLQADALRRFLR